MSAVPIFPGLICRGPIVPGSIVEAQLSASSIVGAQLSVLRHGDPRIIVVNNGVSGGNSNNYIRSIGIGNQ